MSLRSPTDCLRALRMGSASTIPLLLLGSPPAVAAPASEEVAAIVQSPEGAAPDVVLACAPVGSVLKEVGRFAGIASLLDLQSEGARAQYWLGLLDPDVAGAAGFDLDGAAVMAVWMLSANQAPGWVALPFAGTPEQARDVLAHLGEAPVEDVDGGWTVANAGGDWRAHLKAGRLYLRQGIIPGGSSAQGDVALVDDLPTDPGCVIYAAPKGGMPSMGVVAASMYLPLDGSEPIRGRVRAKKAAPPVLGQAEGFPVGGSSVGTPAIVFAIDVSMNELLADPAVADISGLKADQLQAIDRRVRILPGTTVALFKPSAANETPPTVAVLPMARPNGKAMRARRLWRVSRKLARAGDIAWRRTGRRSFDVAVQGIVLHVTVVDGELVVGTDAGLVADVAAGKGEPWVDSALSHWASQWPLAARLYDRETILTAGAPIYGGVRSHAGVWEVAMTVRSKGGALPRVPPAPRPVDALDANPVAWTGGAEWQALGWAPRAKVRGTYWVEVSPDGASFTVHAAIDSDGDGVPARFSRSLGGPLRQETGGQVH